jgi:GT2 family glycosyltransferase
MVCPSSNPAKMEKAQIIAVVVLYKREAAASETISSLATAFAANPALLQAIQVLVWDNSPVPATAAALSFAADFEHSSKNLGTSGAYNYAMELAETRGCPWLLLLDQDTNVSEEFLVKMVGYSERFLETPDVATVVPFIFSHGSLVSPRRLLSFNRVRQIPVTFSGLCKNEAYAVNSGTLMKVAALREVGGYSEEFWLDLSDVYVFRGLYRKGCYMYVAGDLHVQHSIASMDFDREMSPERYRNFLAAESAHIDLFLPPFERAAQLGRLFLRSIRQYLRYKNKTFAKIAWEYFLQRLFMTRAGRLKHWRAQLRQRELPATATPR